MKVDRLRVLIWLDEETGVKGTPKGVLKPSGERNRVRNHTSDSPDTPLSLLLKSLDFFDATRSRNDGQNAGNYGLWIYRGEGIAWILCHLLTGALFHAAKHTTTREVTGSGGAFK
jgi:hypothetical protein